MKSKILALLAGLCLSAAATQAQTLPVFSSESGNDASWYYIIFSNSGNAVLDNGAGNAATQALAEVRDAELWKLVGNQSSFKLISKSGNYAVINSSTRLATSKTDDNTGVFSLVATTNSNFAGSWEIVANSINTTNNRLNQWAGTSVGNGLGFWSAGDQNNPLTFVPQSEIKPADFAVKGSTTWKPENRLTLWYTTPATLTKVNNTWMEYSLPIGNGQLGASLFNGVSRDQVLINEKTLWQGASTDNGSSYGGYMNFGSLMVDMLDEAGFGYTDDTAARDYYRALDISTATGVSGFTSPDGSVAYTRHYIASNPDGVIAVNIEASKPGSIYQKFTLAPGTPGLNATTSYADGCGHYNGKLRTVAYDCRIKVVPTGGTMTTTADGITVKGADRVLVIVKGATDFDPYSATYVSGQTQAQLAEAVEKAVDAAATKGWDAMLADHVADHKALFDRNNFEIRTAANLIPTNELVDQYNGALSATNIFLEELYYNYGRYLEIASSRGVDLPSNLQGIWNNSSAAPWNADIHANINVQMNYWPAESTNLSELHLPLLNYIINMATNHTEWQKYAKDAGQTKGWTCYTENNIFGGVGSFMHNYTIANAWYCTHLWQHYRYTLDREFLAKAFPTMWSATEYWLERLKLATDGTYVAPSEYSPEQGPTEDGTAHAQQLIADLFVNTLAAAETLGVDHDLATLRDRYEKLDKGLATENYTGAWGTGNGVQSGDKLLREWKYSSYTSGENGHRHMSHLMAVYPFNQITPDHELYEAAVNSMKLRGDASTGWSMGWKINLWARLLQGNRARTILRTALRHSTSYGTNQAAGGIYYNLFDSHSPFQIDGNFGSCAGIAELYLQSQNDELYLFPSVPGAWRNSTMTGLKAIGDFTVDLRWTDGKPESAVITSNQGQPLKLRHASINEVSVTINGEAAKPTATTAETMTLDTKAGDIITVDFTTPASIVNIAADESLIDLSVSGRTVTALSARPVASMSLIDLQGRTVASVKGSTVAVPESMGNVVLVSVTDDLGHTVSHKVIVK